MKKIIIILVSLSILFTLSACDRNEDVEKDLTDTLNAISADTIDEHSYIYNTSLNHTDNIHTYSDEITKKIASKVKFSILDISSIEETAEAEIKLIAPDAYQMMDDIASTMQEESVEILLKTLNLQLDKDFSTKEFKITVNLRLVDDHWYLIPNGQLANAFAGGLIEKYSMMGKDKVDKLVGEEAENE